MCFVVHVAGPLHEELADARHDLRRQHADGVRVDRHVAPAQEASCPRLDGALLDNGLAAVALALLLRQEGHADGVLARVRQVDVVLGALALEELVRHLDQDAGAVAGAQGRRRTAPR